jgi:Family of unknown function (DUF5320)
MPWRDGTGPRGRGSRTGRGGGFCTGTGRSSAFAEIVGNLAVGLLAWGGQALSRRLAAGRTLPPPETPSVIEVPPDRPAIGAGDRAGELVELLDRARSLERELEAVRQRIRTLESDGKR